MSIYASLFKENNITGKRLLLLEEEDLKDMGIVSKGHIIHLKVPQRWRTFGPRSLLSTCLVADPVSELRIHTRMHGCSSPEILPQQLIISCRPHGTPTPSHSPRAEGLTPGTAEVT